MSTSDLYRTRSFRLLSSSEERELAQRIEDGRSATTRLGGSDERHGDRQLVASAMSARAEFIECNVRLVLSIVAKAKLPPHADRDDVVQDGMIGLEKAVERFDWRRGFKFSTYATWWIRQSIQRGLEVSSAVRIPAHRHAELRDAFDDLEHGTASRRGGDVGRMMALARLESLDRTVGDGSSSIADLTPSIDAGPDQLVADSDERASVWMLLEHLEPSTARAVIRRFGLDGSDPATYAEIAEDLGVSAESVRRRITRAVDRLRTVALAAAA